MMWNPDSTNAVKSGQIAENGMIPNDVEKCSFESWRILEHDRTWFSLITWLSNGHVTDKNLQLLI